MVHSIQASNLLWSRQYDQPNTFHEKRIGTDNKYWTKYRRNCIVLTGWSSNEDNDRYGLVVAGEVDQKWG